MTGGNQHRARLAALIARQPATIADHDGVGGSLQRLCRAVTQALSASGAALVVMAEEGKPGVMVASDPERESLTELQLVLGEGPCLEAFNRRRPVLVPELGADAMIRWPAFVPAARDAGVQAVFAFPLQVGAARLGVLDLDRARSGPLSHSELGDALSFAELALTTLLDGQEQATTADGLAGGGLAGAVERRAELFQAQGMVMVQLGVSLAEALARMRAYAYAQSRQLGEVAADVIALRLRFEPDPPHPQADQLGAGRQP